MPRKPAKLGCPRGHALPHKGPEGECTPIRCGAPAEEVCVDKRNEVDKVTSLAKAKAKGGSSEDVVEKVESQLEIAKGVALARRKAVGTPEGLEGSAAEAHVTKRLVDLTPYAVAELEYQMLYGSDKQRAEMALEVLDRAGFGKKGESGGVGGPVIVVNMGNSALPPWAPKTIDVTPKKDDGDA